MQFAVPPLAAWRERASNVRCKPLAGSHFLPEEIPEEMLSKLGAVPHFVPTPESKTIAMSGQTWKIRNYPYWLGESTR